MGVVIPFKPRAAMARASVVSDAKQQVLAALESGCDCGDLLVAARPLLGHLHRQFGFSVMTDGLPDNPRDLCTALFLLADGLDLLAFEVKTPVWWSFGAYFGRDHLAWVDDSYGSDTGLAVPGSITPVELAHFVRPRIIRRRVKNL
jgi:hypothetical protein